MFEISMNVLVTLAIIHILGLHETPWYIYVIVAVIFFYFGKIHIESEEMKVRKWADEEIDRRKRK